MLAKAMLDGFNIANSDAIILFSQAVRTNPAPLARTFDLDTLGREGVLEHDFSLRYANYNHIFLSLSLVLLLLLALYLDAQTDVFSCI